MKRRDFVFLGSAGFLSTMTANSVTHSLRDKTEWQPDGLGALGKIGILTPDFDPVPESEIRAMAPVGISIHSARVKYLRNNPGSFVENVEHAITLLAKVQPKVILYAFISSSYTLGVEAEQQLILRLEKLTNGIPVIFTSRAAIEAFRLFNARKITLIHPPWFLSEVNTKGRSYFESQGFDVVSCNQLTPLRDFTEVAPREVYQWVHKNAPIVTDAIFLAGNGLRTAGAITKLEKDIKKPIFSANQVLLWAALRQIGLASKVTNYGQVFRKS